MNVLEGILESACLSVGLFVSVRLCVSVLVCVQNTSFCQSTVGVLSHIE